MKDSMYRNSEGYHDPTPGTVWSNMQRDAKKQKDRYPAVIGNLIPVMKQTAELAGFEVVGRIILRDKATGKEYR